MGAGQRQVPAERSKIECGVGGSPKLAAAVVDLSYSKPGWDMGRSGEGD